MALAIRNCNTREEPKSARLQHLKSFIHRRPSTDHLCHRPFAEVHFDAFEDSPAPAEEKKHPDRSPCPRWCADRIHHTRELWRSRCLHHCHRSPLQPMWRSSDCEPCGGLAGAARVWSRGGWRRERSDWERFAHGKGVAGWALRSPRSGSISRLATGLTTVATSDHMPETSLIARIQGHPSQEPRRSSARTTARIRPGTPCGDARGASTQAPAHARTLIHRLAPS